MRRFHVHIAVENLEQSKAFYASLFGAPAVVRDDYAKWMLDDPPVNLAISRRGHATGVNHLGIQVDSEEDLRSFHARLSAADPSIVSEDEAACCYAKSDKYWVADPNGIAWETFHTLETIPTFGKSHWDEPALEVTKQSSTCCAPAKPDATLAAPPVVPAAACSEKISSTSCCGSSKSAPS